MKSIAPRVVLFLSLAVLLGVGWYASWRIGSTEADSIRGEIAGLRDEIRGVRTEMVKMRRLLIARLRAAASSATAPRADGGEGEGEGERVVPGVVEAVAVVVLAGVPAGALRREELAPGLVAEFFAVPGGLFEALEFDPALRLAARIDPVVDFDWGDGRPHELVDADEFAIRWSGFLDAPEEGEYLVSTRSDDGIRLYIDGERVIDHWDEHGPATDRVRARLSAGLHRVRIEYFESGGGATCRLWWQPPGAARAAPVPAARLLHSPDAVPEGVPEVEPAPTF